MQPDAAAVESALDEVLKASPTSVVGWQARVDYQQARGVPMELVLASFRMSALTGSHEGFLMARRARFGLEHWSDLPERDRRTVVRDLLATAELPEFRSKGYRNIVAQKSQDERDDIRGAVIASGLADEQLVRALGL